MTIRVPSRPIHSHLQPDLMPDGTPDTGTWTISGTSRRAATLFLTTTDLSCEGVSSHVHLTPHSATGTTHTVRSSGKLERSYQNPPSPARPRVLLWAEVSLTTPFALGTKSAAKAGLQGQEHMSGSLPHMHTQCCWHIAGSHVSPAPRCHHYSSPRLARGCHTGIFFPLAPKAVPVM